MDITTKKANRPKSEKLDPSTLMDSGRIAHPPRLKRPDDAPLRETLGREVFIKGTPPKVLEVVIKSE